MPSLRKPTVALLSSHELFRHLVSQLLTAQGLGPVLELADKSQLLAGARQPIDILIVDLDYESDHTMELVQTVRRDLPELQIVLLALPHRPPSAGIDGAG